MKKKINTLPVYGTADPEDLDRVLSMVDSTYQANVPMSFAFGSTEDVVDGLISGNSGPFNGNSKAYRDIIKQCMKAYYTVPVVRNIVDIMTDFAAEGLDIAHKDESIQRFYYNW